MIIIMFVIYNSIVLAPHTKDTNGNSKKPTHDVIKLIIVKSVDRITFLTQKEG